MEDKPLNKATPVNLGQHSYWKLAGLNSGTILDNKAQLFANYITPVDSTFIPTGKILPIAGTPNDFQKPWWSGAELTRWALDMISTVFDSKADNNGMRRVAIVEDPKSKRKLELWANKPGLQFYTGNMVKNVKGKGGYVYNQYEGIVLETQGFPDFVNHPNFPSQIVRPGETYHHQMKYEFSF